MEWHLSHLNFLCRNHTSLTNGDGKEPAWFANRIINELLNCIQCCWFHHSSSNIKYIYIYISLYISIYIHIDEQNAYTLKQDAVTPQGSSRTLLGSGTGVEFTLI